MQNPVELRDIELTPIAEDSEIIRMKNIGLTNKEIAQTLTTQIDYWSLAHSNAGICYKLSHAP